MHRLYLIFSLSVALLLVACGGSSEKSPPQAPPTAAETRAATESENTDPTTARLMTIGERVYARNCLSCHQKSGGGVPNLNPPLVDTEWVLGDEARLIEVILNGLNEEIEVNGEVYHNAMASFAQLSDQEIAAVLTYIRNSWGNDAPAISAEKVAAVRASNEQEG